MTSGKERVLKELRRLKRGVTVEHFGKGFRLAARVHELRQDGHAIVTIDDETETGHIARYVLKEEKLCQQA